MGRYSSAKQITLTAEAPPRLRSFLAILLVLIDIGALGAAFWLGYIARRELPLFAVPIDPPSLRAYLPVFLIQT
ncbi:MAG: hypothetical protein CUN49_06100, partial [Candidatus Thermofonsia Clade 1 bacterium]